jgi:type I restriction enzyme R subunit
MPGIHTEKNFETAIEQHLVNKAGYGRANPENFNRDVGIDTCILLNFINETQPKEWQYLKKILKGKADETLIGECCNALNSEHDGCLKVLRHGFKCYGKNFRVAYFAPASGMNPDTKRLYQANLLTITRQLAYSNKHKNTLDLVISLNGIPIATAELKNPLTGQNWQSAVNQYKNDRDPKDIIFQFKKRTLVHFAVDPDEVHMTTRLSGKDTVFLPFNKGSGTGAGNPENPAGYKTAYLWEEVWQRDSLMEILARFIQLETKDKQVGKKIIKKETMLFPRYHQLDSVRKMAADARENSAGHNYLVQHSAGSGKSNSIAWLAYQLSTLYNHQDEKIFDSVVVVTDRLVLDKQIQDTIYDFEHKEGVLKPIEIDSTQLAQGLISGVPIIITTLQKFPFVTEKIGRLPARKYAVIIDEAHSSQGGEGAAEMKGVLAGAAIEKEVKNKAEEEKLTDFEEEILKTMAKRGRQPNISFFAFTATPKYKTLEVFGQKGPDGKPVPFHLYSMRQAIEENFILDVLQHYTTYGAYFNMVKSIEGDPKVDKKKAAKALARFMSLHPHNIAQKTEVMIEHFMTSTRHQLGGKAKAMLVTSSRLHAVRYKQAFDRYISLKGCTAVKPLVAFSGTVIDPDIKETEYTEVSMNRGIREKELPVRFATDDYNVLIAAEKYQTGFDQPLLHTMFVDKRLSGIQAVQTLSRLNRKHPGKENTFILDFVNTTGDILEAFKPYYERTGVGEQVEPRHLYELQARLEDTRIFYKTEVEEFARIFYKPREKQTAADQAGMNACIDPAVSRFKNQEEELKEEFRKVLTAYRNLYAFMSQIIPFTDPDLEKLYTYVRFLLLKLPRRGGGPSYNFDEEVALKYYRLLKIADDVSLPLHSGGTLDGPTEVGTGKVRGEKIELSRLIDILNERFGTDFKPGDQLFFDSIKEDAAADDKLRQAALANTMENFGYVFKKALEGYFIERIDQNEDITVRFMNEKDFQDEVSKNLMVEVYNRIRSEASAAV